MRLTLRTLLAYLDDILEPGDRQSLEQKIQESGYAKKLIERTRDVVIRGQLSAPTVVGRGVVRDANSVAEYLDNTMAPEQVQEFERVCLESDVHLAEVTGCHNVLTIVLGQPAHVTTSMRERMYRLNEGTVMRLSDMASAPAEESASDAVGTASQDTPPPSSVDTKTTKAAEPTAVVAPPPTTAIGSPQIQPAQSSNSRFWLAMVSTAAVAAAVTGILFLVFERFSGDSNAPQVADKQEVNDPHVPGGIPPANPVDESSAQHPPVADNDAPTIGEPPLALDKSPDDTVPENTAPENTAPDNTAPDNTAPDNTAPDDATESTIDDLSVPPTSPAATDQDGAVLSAPVQNADPPVESPDAAAHPIVEPRVSTDEPPATNASPTPAPAPAPTPAPAPAPAPPDASDLTDETAEPAEAAVVGRLLSEDQVLLRTDREMETIMRLPKQADLKVGDRLIALPAFRPLISAASNTMEVDGGTSLEITGLDEKQVPEISLHYGRVLIRALPFPDSRLRVRIGDSVGTLVYEQADSVVGIEVRPYRSPGTDPEQVASMHAVDLYVVSGKIRWISGDQEEVIEAPARKQLSAHRDDKETAFDEQPAWLARSTITALDRRGISTIQQRLQHDSSVSLSLSELAEPKQRFEVRRLALRGCAYVAYFDPLIDALADKEEFNRWFTIFLPELTSAIARDPQTAAKLRRTLERKRGDDAEDLYRMLWGYSRDDLIGAEDPQASKLVDYLDHEDLDYRVLSIWNLRQITGLGLNYRPEDDESDRRKSVVRWRKKANSGEIVPRGTEPGPAAAEK